MIKKIGFFRRSRQSVRQPESHRILSMDRTLPEPILLDVEFIPLETPGQAIRH